MSAFELLDWLRVREFEPDDDGVLALGNVRVVLDDGDVSVHVFGRGDGRFTEEWSVRFRNAPTAAITALIESLVWLGAPGETSRCAMRRDDDG